MQGCGRAIPASGDGCSLDSRKLMYGILSSLQVTSERLRSVLAGGNGLHAHIPIHSPKPSEGETSPLAPSFDPPRGSTQNVWGLGNMFVGFGEAFCCLEEWDGMG